MSFTERNPVSSFSAYMSLLRWGLHLLKQMFSLSQHQLLDKGSVLHLISLV